MERVEGRYGVGNGLDRERVNTIDVARGLLVVPMLQKEQNGCRKQHQDGNTVYIFFLLHYCYIQYTKYY